MKLTFALAPPASHASPSISKILSPSSSGSTVHPPIPTFLIKQLSPSRPDQVTCSAVALWQSCKRRAPWGWTRSASKEETAGIEFCVVFGDFVGAGAESSGYVQILQHKIMPLVMRGRCWVFCNSECAETLQRYLRPLYVL